MDEEITLEELMCKHNWSKRFGGYCLECGMSRQAWVDRPEPRSPEDSRFIALTEQELGLDISKADNYTREYLVPTPPQKTHNDD